MSPTFRHFRKLIKPFCVLKREKREKRKKRGWIEFGEEE